MQRLSRPLLVLTGVGMLIIAAALFVRADWALALWPWKGYAAGLSPLSALFLSSIAAAIAMPVLWIGFTGEFTGITAGALEILVTSAGVSLFTAQSYAAAPTSSLLIAAILYAAVCAMVGTLFVVTSRLPIHERHRLPALIRVSFVMFTIILIMVGSAMVLKQPNVFPWRLTTEMSVVYGWIFMGASAYFLYTLLFPNRHNVNGQLMGFLAYDLVLIVPFVQHWGNVEPELRFNLAVYIAVLVYSGLLSAYYLFFNPATRLRLGGGRGPHADVQR